MAKSKDPLMLSDLMAQREFGFARTDGRSLQVVGTTLEGHTLFKKLEPHGGYSYWSDELAPGVMVYDEGTGNVLTLFAALNDLGVGELLWRHLGEVYGYTKP